MHANINYFEVVLVSHKLDEDHNPFARIANLTGN